jgi:CheY-like chemotaxis protein
MLAYSDFLRELRHALNHLYEPQILRLSPLQSLLAKGDAGHSAMALGNFLIKAIESMKPATDTPGDSPAWQTYEFLYYRYVQGVGQAELGKQLNCSVRQVRRLQGDALAFLAEALLQNSAVDAGQVTARVPEERAGAGDEHMLKYEYDALLAAHKGSSTEVTTELIALSDVLQPLLAQHAVNLRLPATESFINTAIPDVVFRQAFLSMLAAAAHFAAEGQIDIAYGEAAGWVTIDVHLFGGGFVNGFVNGAGDVMSAFDEAASLLALSGGELTCKALTGRRSELTIRLPSAQFVTVLAVDDNKDALQLLLRYTTGTRYQLVTCSEPASVPDLIAKYNPAVITLDVMMAGMDGWQLIRQLRQQPATMHTPIVVCSVLAQEELALSLGVNSYVRKPVSQEAYLAALDRLTSETEKPSPPAPQ